MAGDEQPITIPPPAGEDDAYSAATKVGEMPAEVLAKLRAEGLMPPEEEKAPSAPRPGAGSRRPVVSSSPPDSGGAPPPALFSLPPSPETTPETELDGALENVSDPGAFETTSSRPPPRFPSVQPGTGASVPPGREASTSEAPAELAAAPDPVRQSDAELEDKLVEREVAAFGARGNQRLLLTILVGIGVLLAVAFAMALLSQRR